MHTSSLNCEVFRICLNFKIIDCTLNFIWSFNGIIQMHHFLYILDRGYITDSAGDKTQVPYVDGCQGVDS